MLPGKHKNKKEPPAKQQHPAKNDEQRNTKDAFNEAQKDIEHDADLSVHSKNDDLDEGEAARLGDDETDLV